MDDRSVHYRTCPLCEATCGLEVTVEGDAVVRIRGDLPAELRLLGSNVDGEAGLDRGLFVDKLPAAPGLRGPRALDRKSRRGR